MADYYPLIARAVAGLEKNNGESRRAVYERARAALLTQLRGLTPALDESDITRERLALEESIRKVEAESARKFMEGPRTPQPAPKARPPEPQPAERAAELRPERAPEPRRPRDLDEPPRRYVSPPAPAQEPRADATRRPSPPPPAAKPAPPPRAAVPAPPLKSPPRPPAPPAKEPPAAEEGGALRHCLGRAPERRPMPDDGGREGRDLDALDAPALPRTAREEHAPLPPPEPERGPRREPAAFDRFEPRMTEPQV